MNKRIIIAIVLALVIGAAGGYWYARTAQRMTPDALPVAAPQERKPVFYRNPMNPQVTSPVPAKDSMGMDYIPVYADADAAASEPAGTVKIDPVTEQNIGVRTATASRQTIARTIRAVGRVDYNEERLSRLHPKIEGWIEDLLIDKTGEMVNKDTILLHIYSPQLVTSQQEYLLALNSLQALKNSPYEDIRRSAEELVKTSRERLEFLDVPEHQIRELEENRQVKKSLHIHSPFKGIVVAVGAREGQYVTPETELYMLADLSRIWVYAAIYEDELPWVKTGDEVSMQVTGIPGRTFTGKLTYIYPYAEAETRTIKVRLEFDNPDQLLRPDMFATVTIHVESQQDAVVIPAEAVVRSGLREQVFVVRGAGKFAPRVVKLGVSAGGLVQVLEGLAPGEEIVTSSQFLIDSESKLSEATAKMQSIGAPGPTSQEEAAGADGRHEHGMAPSAEPPPLPVQVPGVGKVETVQPDKRVINITHEPIDALDWPVMTMDFDVDATVALADINPGDQVQFTLNPDAGGHYLITDLRKLGSATQAATETSAPATVFTGMGVVQEVKAAEHKLNIAHEPIAQLSWPAMTMEFAVAPEVELNAIEAGDQIHFTLERDAAGRYRITGIHNTTRE